MCTHLRFAIFLACASSSHGGLTPAALGGRPSLDGEKATFAMHERRHDQERGGRKLPVITRTRLQRRPPTRRSAVCRTIAEARVQVRLQNHGGLTPAAPRACACVHRKSRNSVGRRTGTTKSGGRKPTVVRKPRLPGRFRTRSHSTTGHAGPRAGGVSPPWFHERDCNRFANTPVGSVLSNCGSACASTSARHTVD